MILIFSSASDPNVFHALRWLNYWSKAYLLLNEFSKDTEIVFNFEAGSNMIHQSGSDINVQDVQAVWIRDFKTVNYADETENLSNNELKIKMRQFLISEQRTVYTYLIFLLDGIKRIGCFEQLNLNKLKVLQFARMCGLKTPETHVTSTLRFQFGDRTYITKPLSEIFHHVNGDVTYRLRTQRIFDSAIKTRFPVLLQSEEKKRYEIRTFYLENEFYSICIFSQDKLETQVDYRAISKNTVLRKCPFALPSCIEERLLKLFQMMNLNSGSADMIYTTSGEFVFLEINPVGQYDVVSKIGNYYLDKKIAAALNA